MLMKVLLGGMLYVKNNSKIQSRPQNAVYACVKALVFLLRRFMYKYRNRRNHQQSTKCGHKLRINVKGLIIHQKIKHCFETVE